MWVVVKPSPSRLQDGLHRAVGILPALRAMLSPSSTPRHRLRPVAVAGAVVLHLLFAAVLALRPSAPTVEAPKRLVVVTVPPRLGLPAPEPEATPLPAPRTAPARPRPARATVSPVPSPAAVSPPVAIASPPSASPASAASAPPLRLDDATLRRATAGARRGSVGDLAQGTGAPIDDTRSAAERFTEGVDRSKRADCRVAHASKGLFAPIFLLRDTVNDTGCKW